MSARDIAAYALEVCYIALLVAWGGHAGRAWSALTGRWQR
jgi:hypothetical protein